MSETTRTVRINKDFYDNEFMDLAEKCNLKNSPSVLARLLMSVGLKFVSEWITDGKIDPAKIADLSIDDIKAVADGQKEKKKEDKAYDMKEAARDPRGFFLYLKENASAREDFIKKSRKHLSIERVAILEKMIDNAKEDCDE